MRTCAKCGHPKNDEDFALKRGTSRHSYCRPCQATYHADHHQKNKVVALQKNRDRRKVLRGVIVTAKERLGYLCQDCGLPHPTWRLDFDHRPGEVKVREVSRLPQAMVSDKTLLDEIAKCDLVCANCHRDRTHARNESPSN